MSLQLPQIKGENLIIAISASSSASLLAFGDRDMSGALDVEADEVVEILEPGFCLIEMPDQGRFIARMENGSVTGPMRIMQIEEFDIEALQAKPVPVSKALVVVPGEAVKDIPDRKTEKSTVGSVFRFALAACSILMGAALVAVGMRSEVIAHEAMLASGIGAANLVFGLTVLVLFGRERQSESTRRSVAERAAEARRRRASAHAVPAAAG